MSHLTNKSATLKGRNIGLTLSHYEFDIALLDELGDVDPQIALKGALEGETYKDVLQQLDVLRFMNWQKTNVTPEFYHPPMTLDELLEWEQRDWWREFQNEEIGLYPFQEKRGVPLPICVRVAAFHGSYPWICIPHASSDREFTRIMRYTVDKTLAELKKYKASALLPIFEFSNEVWNSGRFEQQREIANVALNRPITARFSRSEGTRAFKTALEVQVKRTNEIADYVGDRGFTVLAAQAGNNFVAKKLLAKHLSPNVDALAIAPYFGTPVDAGWRDPDLPHGFHPFFDPNTGKLNANPAWGYHGTVPHMTRNLRAFIDRKLVTTIRQHREMIDAVNKTRTRPLRLWTYEGGLDLHYSKHAYGRFFEPQVKEIFTKFNRSEAAGELTDYAVRQFFAEGGDLWVGYSSATVYEQRNPVNGKLRHDYFGHIDLQDEDGQETYSSYFATPRLRSLLDAKQTRRRRFRTLEIQPISQDEPEPVMA